MIRIMMAQVNPKVGDIDGNGKMHLEVIDAARSQSVDLVVFTELSLLGYPPKDLLLQNGFVERGMEWVSEIAKHTTGIAIIIGHAQKIDGDLYNVATFIENREIKATFAKSLLPNYNVFDERRYFKPSKFKKTTVNFKGVKIGIQICEDMWDEEYDVKVTEQLVEAGANLIVNISASPFQYSKRYSRFSLLREKTFKYKIAMLYVNQVGGQDELIFDGESVAFNPGGIDVATAKKFSEHLFIIEYDETIQQFLPVNSPQQYSTIQEIHDALVLGTRDYCRKNGFKGVILGLSGGIDSALTAAIAVKALGKDNVFGVLMPSSISSSDSVTDAEELAHSLDIKHEIVSIANIVDGYVKTLLPVLAPESDDFHTDVTLQNLQARARGNVLMAFSNDLGYLVLSTGNKSENAVGYCTLYGDMAGGLNVIGDVFKTKVYELSEYVNNPKVLIPVNTITKPPTADLKPGQKDQDDLPPYEILDGMLKHYLEEGESVNEIVKRGYDLATVQKIVRKVERNEHKRRQAAISLVITPRDLKNGRRMPITNGFNY